ncbi:MAG: MarR family transcriptional regulator [Actinobacteria bacterium]|nr:MarR family transcriptional regulator [Actinomycetota bacterium]
MGNDRKKLTEKILENINAIKRKIAAEMHIFFDEASITHSQWVVLYFIKKNKNINIKDLANLLGVTSSAATQIVDGLVNKGLLLRRRSPDDRRTLRIELSEKSKNQFDSIKNQSFKTLSSLFDVLDDDELLKYCELNNKIADKILLKTQERKKDIL